MAVKVPLFDPTLWQASSTPASLTFNGSNDKAGVVMIAPRSCRITKVGFYLTDSAFSGTLRVGVETLTGNVPNSAATYVGTEAVVNSVSTGWNWFTVNADVTAGVAYALTLRCTAFTSGSFTFRHSYTGYGTIRTPFVVSGLDGAAWTTVSTANVVAAALTSDMADGAGGLTTPNALSFGALPVTAVSVSTTTNDGTNPDEVGVKFVAPYGGCLTGIFAMLNLSAAHSGISTFTLYDDADNALQAVNWDSRSISAPTTVGKVFIPCEQVPATKLNAGSTYRLTYKGPVGDVTNTTRLMTVTWANDGAGSYESLRGGSYGECVCTSRNNGGTWTDDETRSVAVVPYLTLPDGAYFASGGSFFCS